MFTPGTDYFFSQTFNADPLSGTAPGGALSVYNHQSAVAFGLGPGTYRIGYDTVNAPTSQDWLPLPSIQTATFTVTAGGGVIVDTGGPPNVSLSGPSGDVTGPFTVTATFSEDVTGVETGDFNIVNGTISNLVEVSPSVYTFTVTPTPAASTGGVQIDMPAGGAIDTDTNPNTASEVLSVTISSSPAVVDEEVLGQIIAEEELKTLREQLLRNRRMARGARGRLAQQLRCRTVEEEDLSPDELLECDNLLKQAQIPLDTDGSLIISEGRVLFNGSFFGQIEKNDGERRRLVFGEFSVTDDQDFGTIATIDGRIAWERMVSDDALFGYFVGAEASVSDVQGFYSGDRNRLGLSAGVYGAKDLNEGIMTDGFLTFGIGRNTIDVTDGAVTVDGDYTALTIQAGAAISGEREYENYDLRPELAFSYGYTDIGDIDYAALATGISSDGVFSGDTVALGTLSFTPEILVPMDFRSETYDIGTFRVAPSIQCDWIDSGTSRNDCGGALELELSARSNDGLREVSGRIRTEVIGDNTRHSVALSLEHDF